MPLIAIYMRVSTEAQAERGTIEAQREFAEKYVDLHELADNVQYYAEDGFTGTIPLSARPVGSQLMAGITAGKINEVLVYKIDRFGRNTRVILNSVYELEQAGAIIKSMTEPFDTSTPTGRFMLSIMASVAALDRDNIVERLTNGVNRAARLDNRWMGGIVPLGYHIEDHCLVVDEEESKTVRLIYDLALKKYSTVKIAEHLNALKIPTVYTTKGYNPKKGATTGLWFPGRIYIVLTSELYKGTHTYGKKRKDDKPPIVRKCPAIIDEEVWDSVQDTLRMNQIDSIGDSKNFYLLRGLLECENCGRSFSGNTKRGKQYYRCNGRSKIVGRDTRCFMPSLDATLIETYIWDQILMFAENPDEIDKYFDLCGETKKVRSFINERAMIEKAIKEHYREYSTLLDMILKESVSRSVGELKLSQIEASIGTLKERLISLDSESISTNLLVDQFPFAKEKLKTIVGNVDAEDPETKRSAIRLIVDKIRVSLVPDEDNPDGKKKLQLRVKYSFLRSEVIQTNLHGETGRRFCPARSFA